MCSGSDRLTSLNAFIYRRAGGVFEGSWGILTHSGSPWVRNCATLLAITARQPAKFAIVDVSASFVRDGLTETYVRQRIHRLLWWNAR
jgi:hypothetical protein